MRAGTFSLYACAAVSFAQKLLLTNDDGWATVQMRDQYESLKAAKFDVIVSAPADDLSGTGSATIPISVPLVKTPCQFDTCPLGSPGTGSDASDPRINYFNAFPVDAARYGLRTLSPEFFHSKPDLVVSGPNIGENAGLDVFVSGTVGAAIEGEKEGVPSVAFSGISTEKESYTMLGSNATSPTVLSAHVYSALTTKFVQTLFHGTSPPHSRSRLVPRGTIINVNYPALNFASGSKCSKEAHVQWIFARLFPAGLLPKGHDIEICHNGKDLPDGADVVEDTNGCYASVVVLDSETKLQADAKAQQSVYKSLSSLDWRCWSKSK